MPDARRLGCLLLLVLLALAAWFGWREYQRLLREEPERFPWTPLSLADPAGPFTRQKIGALAEHPQRCEALFAAIGGRHGLAPPQRPEEDARCGYDRALVLRPISDSGLAFSPRGLVTSCPVAAALHLWERDTVQPAALRLLGERIATIDHYGSYSCRRLYGRPSGDWSEHARANAIDIAGFRLADGQRITVAANWKGDGPEATFLHQVRNGACKLFATTLSPDYNAAHHDHLHLDQAERGEFGWRACR